MSISRTAARVAVGSFLALLSCTLFAKEDAAPIARTPQGVECPKGIIVLEARSNTEFVVDGAPTPRKDLAKSLRKARKVTPFDCVVIDGGHPGTDELPGMIRELSRMTVHHVEWSGTLPTTPEP